MDGTVSELVQEPVRNDKSARLRLALPEGEQEDVAARRRYRLAGSLTQ